MHSGVILQVRVMNGSVTGLEALNQICTHFDCDTLLHVYTPEIVFIFLHPNACPLLRKSRLQQNDGIVGHYYFKHRRGLSRVSEEGVRTLNKLLYAYGVSRLWYNVQGQTFIDASSPSFPVLSKRIQHLDQIVSLKEVCNRRTETFTNKNAGRKITTTRGYISSSHSAFYNNRDGRVVPFHDTEPHLPLIPERHPSVHRDHPVQATDGPHENVVYHCSITNTELPVDSVSSRQRALSRHPEYSEARVRRQTYGRWPHRVDVQDVDILVQCGFYYTGTFDMVRCYQCGLGLKDWSYLDEPWLEHVRYSQHCLHIQNTLEPDLLEQYLTRVTTGYHGSQNVSEAAAGPRLRHPEYVSLDARMKTFSRWPSNRVQRPKELAEAGFYYTGFSDQVRCYACDGGLQHWDRDDEPWVEHARWFSHCQHVKDSRGEYFIEMVRLAAQDAEDEMDQGGGLDTLSGNLKMLTVNDASGSQLESDDPIYSPDAQKVVLSLGFSRAAVKMVIQECSDKKIRWNADILAGMLYDKQSKGESLPLDSPRPSSPVDTPVNVSTESGLMAEHRRLLTRLKCLGCEENDANVLFLPCAHHKMCMECSTDADICPLCCKQIKQKVRTYMA